MSLTSSRNLHLLTVNINKLKKVSKYLIRPFLEMLTNHYTVLESLHTCTLANSSKNSDTKISNRKY